jgi:hypothetical protein
MPSGCLKDCINLQMICFLLETITLAVTMAALLLASSLKGLTPMTELSTPKLTEQKPIRNFFLLKKTFIASSFKIFSKLRKQRFPGCGEKENHD